MKDSVVVVFTLWIVFMFGSLQQIGAQEGSSAKNLFESKCGLCHSIERPKSKKKTKEEWKATVMRMKNVNGAPISDDQAQSIIDYLAVKHGK